MSVGQPDAEDLLEALAEAVSDEADAMLMDALGGCLGDLVLPGGGGGDRPGRGECEEEEGMPAAAAV
jgi:hypothetical protein